MWLRANFITSIDGGAAADGKTGPMAGPGDRLIFFLLRELADVIVVGAGTVRVEGYSGAHAGIAERQRRQARGQSEVPQLAIVSKSGRLERDMGVFTRTEVPRWCSPAGRRRRRAAGCSATWPWSSTAPAWTQARSTRPPCWPCCGTAACAGC